MNRVRGASANGNKAFGISVSNQGSDYLLVIALHVLGRGVELEGLGTTYFDERHRERTYRWLTRRHEALGDQVSAIPRS